MIPIPSYIKNELRSHILSNCARAEAGWEFANQDEDTLTGDFLGNFRTEWRQTDNFSWRFSYNKVRGRGTGALEKKTGTDGLITLHYRDSITNRDYYKSLVFQAKKHDNKVDLGQWHNMNLYFREGNAIFNYSPDGYQAYTNIQQLESRQGASICSLIATDFLECSIGIPGLRYNSQTNLFIKPDGYRFKPRIKHELLIDIFENSRR